VSNANSELEYRSGSLVSIDLDLVDLTRQSHNVGDVAVAHHPLPSFSGPVSVTDVVVGTAGSVPTAIVSNRLTETVDGVSQRDRVFFVKLGADGGVSGLDLDPDSTGIQESMDVGQDPYGHAVDPVLGRFYVANGTSGNVSAINLMDPCPFGEEEEALPPCLVDAVGAPDITDAVYVPVDAMNPSDVELADAAVAALTTPTENWTVTFVEDEESLCGDELGFWRVRGQVRGPQRGQACTGVPYATDGGEVIFTVQFPEEIEEPAGPLHGDQFTFQTQAGDFLDDSPVQLSTIADGVPVSGLGVSQLAVDSTTGWLYATVRPVRGGTAGFVFIVDPVVGLPEAVAPVGTGTAAADSRGIAVSSDGTEIYVANRSPDALLVLAPGGIADLPGAQLESGILVDAVALGSAPSEVVLTADGSHALVTCFGEGAVYAVNLATRTVSQVTATGTGPFTLTLSADGGLAFVSNYIEHSVSVLDADPASPTFLRVLTTIQ
jgi:DNA-binding beta-propeller fold protein YncE